MDTGTHFVVGLGLAGLAYIDPVVAADSNVSTAVLIGTVLGSQAPDSDGLLRLKSNASYIKNHRGLSHSIPAIAIWTFLITLMLSLVFQNLPIFHVGLWVFIAVAFHVFSDLFNTYGTQAMRPFTEKWISWNIIHIFDPFIFVTHLIGISLWLFRIADPAYIFSVLYVSLAFYYIWRSINHHYLEKNLYKKDTNHQAGDKYIMIPTYHLNIWHVVKQKQNMNYSLGELKHGKLKWVEQIKCAEHPAVEISKKHPDIAALLYFSPHPCAEIRYHSWGYEIHWVDVRYRYRKQFPFVGVLLMDHEYQALGSYVGWLSETRIEKKLRLNTQG